MNRIGMNTKMLQRSAIVLAAAFIVAGLVAGALAAEPNLMAAVFVKGRVGLKWAAVGGATEYYVYRKDAGGEFTRIATVKEDHWFDVAVTPGTTYTYKIAVTEGGGEVFSGEKSVTIPGQAGAFEAPVWVGVRVEQNKVFLNWDPVPGAIAYNIFRSTTPGSGYESVGTAEGSRYVDNQGLERGVTYYYVLSALNGEFAETPQSEERAIKFGQSAEEVAAAQAEANKIELVPVNLKKIFEVSEGTDGLTMNQPSDVAVSAAGDIYVTDTLNSRVVCFDAGGKLKFAFGSTAAKTDNPDDLQDETFLMPFTLFIDGKGEVYVSDIERHDIQVFALDGRFVRRIRVDTGAGMDPLRANGLHVLADGRLVMTDAGNHRFLVADASGKILKAVGKRGTAEGEFIFPDELTVTKDGIVCIVEPINCRIQQFDLDGKFVRAFGEVGQSAGMFARPKGIAVDGAGGLWVSDGMSNMVQVFTADGTVKSAIGTVNDPWAFITPRGMVVQDGKMLLVERLRNTVTAFSIEP